MDLYELRNLLNQGKSIYEIPLRVVYYARVSTDKEEQLNSLENQISYFENFIKNNRNWKFIDGYYDEGISGVTAKKRDSFMEMIKDAKDDKFDFIITKEISRFSRSTLDSIKYTQDLLSYGVGVLFQSDNINTLLPDSELRLTIMSSIAQDELRKLSDRVKFGFKKSISDGRVLGSSNIYGYVKDNGKLVIDEDEAKIVRLIFELYISGMGIRAVIAELSDRGIYNREGHDFSFGTIKRILSNPKYKGYYCGNKTSKVSYNLPDIKFLDSSEWVYYEDHKNVPPIVSKEVWERANAVLSKRVSDFKERKVSYDNKYIYSGKIVCAEHNCSFQHAVYRYKSGDKEVWQCKIYKDKGKKYCDSPTLYTEEIDEIVKYILKFLNFNKAEIIEEEIEFIESSLGDSKIDDDISRIKSKVSAVIKRKDKLLDLSIGGVITTDEFKQRNEKFNEELSVLESELSRLEDTKREFQMMRSSTGELRKILSAQIDTMDCLTKDLVDSIIDKMVVRKTDDKNVVELDVYLKIIHDVNKFVINRKRGKESLINDENGSNINDFKTSVCSPLSIL